ncbi:MAG: translocation/assembly module TamB domain-containing protein [Deltaproteobacteria bacterium]|nr:translocation/assembly module TamB domain-containing protein [Deltaproteobacteria bacterium]
MKKHLGTILLFFFTITLLSFYLVKGNLLNYFLKPYFETYLSQASGLQVQIKSLDLSLWKTSLEVQGLSLLDAPTTFIEIPRISASIQRQALFIGKLALKDAVFFEPKIKIDLSTNVQKKKQSPAFFLGSPIVSYDFRKIEIQKSSLTIIKNDSSFEARDVSLQLHRKQKNTYDMTLSLQDQTITSHQTIYRIAKTVWSGSWKTPLWIEGNVSIDHLTSGKQVLPHLKAHLRLHPNQLALKDIFIETPFLPLRANAMIDFEKNWKLKSIAGSMNENPLEFSWTPDQKLLIKIPHLDLKKFFHPYLLIEGEGESTLTLPLGKKPWEAEATLQLKNLTVQKIFLGKAHLSASIKYPQLTYAVTLTHPHQEAAAKLTGNLTWGPSLQGRGFLEAHHFSIWKENFKSASLSFDIEKSHLYLKDAFLIKKRGQFLLSGSLSTSGKVNLFLSSKEISLQEFDQIPRWIDGPFTVEARLQNTLQDPSFHAVFSVPETMFREKSLGLSSCEITFKKQTLALRAFLFDKNIQTQVMLSTQKDLPYHATLNIQNFDITPLIYFFHHKFLDISVVVRSHFEWDGALRTGWVSQGSFVIESLSLTSKQLSIQNKGSLQVHAHHNQYTVDHFFLEGTHTALAIQGTIVPKGPVRLSLEGPFDLSILSLATAFFEKSAGMAKISAHIEGTTQKPVVFGSFYLNSGELKTSWFPALIENISSSISFSQNKISIEKFQGHLGNGILDISGTALFEKKEPVYDIRTKFKEVSLQFPSWLYSTASGELALSGSKRPYLLHGNVEILESIYKENIDWRSKIIALKKARYLPKVQDTGPSPLTFDISIQAPKNIFVQNNLAKLEASGKLKVFGDPKNIYLTGQLNLLNGLAFFKNNEFQLKAASLTFADKKEIDPDFFIQAETEVKTYKISLKAEGKLSEYHLTLSSDPSLPDADILSLLAFGTVRSNLSDQSLVDVTSLELGALLFGGVQEKIQEGTKKTLGITFRLSPSYSDTKHATVPRLLISKPFGKHADLLFSSTLDKSTVFSDKEFNLKYHFNRNLSIVSYWEDLSDEELQDNSSLGIDLQAQIEFP